MASMDAGGSKKKRAPMFLCSVPYKECSGKVQDNCGMHSSQDEVKRCKEHWLVKQGYVKIGPREYKDPKDGRILVLCKKASRAKPGKADRYMAKGHNGKNKMNSW